ncbi:MAG: acyloxyacyl hydrolase [Bacteroidales bacterium]|jgi:hypothetical protein
MESHKKKMSFVLVVTALLLGSHLYGQSKSNWMENVLVETRVNYGFLINHHLEMEIYNSHFPMFEINIGKETFGKKRWHSHYLYPFLGLGYQYSHLGNSDILGSSHAVFPYINYPLFRNSRKSLNFRVGLGLAYLTKCYDRINNYKYIAIGSHINAAANFVLEYRYEISTRLQTSIGLSLTHFSNGSTKNPNYGINIPTVDASLAYRLKRKENYREYKLLPDLYVFEFPKPKSFDFSANFNVAFKDMENINNRKFMVYNFAFTTMKRISYKSSFGAAVDITSHGADYYIADYDSVEYKRKSQLLRVGASAMYKLSMSKLHYYGGMGFYFNGKVVRWESYFKVGLQYDITDYLFADLTLRTNFGKADFVGLGLGYKFTYYGDGRKHRSGGG